MTDGRSHFDNDEVNTYCKENGIEHITTPAYVPWTNGLVENSNKILLGRLKRMCAPDLDDTKENDLDPELTPTQWTDHLDEVVRSMNDRILPALGFTPHELLWGQWEKREEKLTVEKESETTEHDATHHLIFTELLCSQGYTDALAEATRRKAHFDDQVHPVEFNARDLVQVYNSKLDVTYETKAKLLSRWSPP